MRFRASEANRFDQGSFAKLFVAAIVRETPQLSLEEAFVLSRSSKLDESYLGMTVLFRKHPNVLEVWDDQENSISRGSLGQSVEAIISSLPRSSALLRDVADSSDLEMFVREVAALKLAMNEGAKAEPTLSSLATCGSWYAGEILEHFKQYGHINPYA